MSYIAFVIYLLMSASGLILLKSGSGNFALNVSSNLLNLSISTKMLVGLALYVFSFLLFIFIIPKFNLSYIYPMSAGLLYIIILVASIFFLNEKVTTINLLGSALILSGIVAINIK